MPSCETTAFPGVSTQTNIAATAWTVESAQKAIDSAKLTIELFLQLEHDNRTMVKTKLPEVHAVAEQVRKQYASTLNKALRALKAFEESRTPNNETTLSSVMNVLLQLQANSKTQVAKIKS